MNEQTEQTNIQEQNWLDQEQKELEQTSTFDGEMLPALKLEEKKVTGIEIDFSKPFEKWTSPEGTVKKIIPILYNGEKMDEEKDIEVLIELCVTFAQHSDVLQKEIVKVIKGYPLSDVNPYGVTAARRFLGAMHHAASDDSARFLIEKIDDYFFRQFSPYSEYDGYVE